MTAEPRKPRQEASFLSDGRRVSHQEEPTIDSVSGKKHCASEWQLRFEAAREAISPATIARVAKELGVTARSLEALEIGFEGHAVVFPIRSADGEIVGLRQRPMKNLHKKLCARSSALGLFIPSLIRRYSMVLLGGKPDSRLTGPAELVCEGESDLAAALSLGHRGIATPGTAQCTDAVARYYAARPAVIPCIMAHADRGGRRGAERLVRTLLTAGTPCRELIAPEEHNDLRGWLTKGGLTPALLAEAIKDCPIRWPDDAACGFFMQPNWIIRRKIIARVGPTAWAVYCIIASFADKHGRCYPTREQLAALMDVTIRTVDTAKERLRDAGLLDWRRGGSGRASTYQIRDFHEFRGKTLDTNANTR